MKELPDEKTLLELLEMARIAAEKAKAMSDMATEIEQKWRRRVETRRQTALQQSQGIE